MRLRRTTNENPEASPSAFARWRTALWGFVAISLASAAVLATGVLSEDAAFDFSPIVYAVIPAIAGGAVMVAAITLRRRERIAWLTIGTGVLAWGLGETTRTLVEAHHGKIIQKRSEILGGACFVVSLPLSLQPAPVTPQAVTTAASAHLQ